MLLLRARQLSMTAATVAATSTSSASSSASSAETQAQAALDYCVRIVRERDYENYAAALLMPPAARPRIFSILAFNAEVSTLRHKIKRHSGVAGINQLTFWHEALEVFGGEHKGRALLPRQPAMLALQAYADPAELPLLLALVEARQQTLGDRPFATTAALEQHSRALYGSLLQLQMNALHTFGPQKSRNYPSKTLQSAVQSMAYALGIVTLLRGSALLLREGLILLPSDACAIHEVTPDMMVRDPTLMRRVVHDLCRIAETQLDWARDKKAAVSPPHLRLALLTAGLRADHTLKILRSNRFSLLDRRLHRPPPLAGWKLWWRSRRQTF